MANTRTGNFPIAFRRGGSDWQKDLPRLVAFATSNAFAGLDVGALPAPELKQITDAGLRLGSVDLPQKWTDLASPDDARRRDAADRAAAYVREAAAVGAKNFFVVVLPEDFGRSRSDNLDAAADGYARLCDAIADLAPAGVRIAVEGWPGPAPHYPSLACTPADYRLLFERVGSPIMAVNYDPSHLVRMGIDPLRFVEEFAPRIAHVHAKDTELFDDDLYEHGNLQPATLEQPHRWGGHHWRYTIPGHGLTPWTRVMTTLAHAGYEGVVSIELEDENFNGTEAGEQRGLLASRDFLASV